MDKVDDKLTKIGQETQRATAQITELQLMLENLTIPQEVVDKINRIQGHLDEIDALVPDVEPPAESA